MINNKNEVYSDFIIKQAVHEDMKNAPEMPYSEDETWNMIQKKMRNEPSFKKGKRRKFTKLSLIAASILLVFSFVQVQSGNAFGWLTKYVFKSEGTVTNIESSNTTSVETNIPSPEQVKIIPSVIKTKYMDLSQAKAAASFNIIIPQYVPEGFMLQNVGVVLEGEKSNEITLNYKKGEEPLTIKQSFITEQFGNSFAVDNEDTIVKKVDVFNQEATFLRFEDNSKKLFWDNMQLRFEIDSNLPEEEILKIAHSM